MGKGKLLKFADNEASGNVIQSGNEFYESCKGNWSKFFKNENPIVIELACGRGEYTTGLASEYKNKNFIGIDIKGARIWKGSQMAQKEGLLNVAFLRTHIQNLEAFFEEEEISEIWIIHPDPRPKDGDERRRITNHRFMDIYKLLIAPGGIIRFKTDNTQLYQYTLATLNDRKDVHISDFTEDLYKSKMNEEHHGIRTRYEEEFTAEGQMIKCIKFSFNNHE